MAQRAILNSRRKLLGFASASFLGASLSSPLFTIAATGARNNSTLNPPGNDPTPEQMLRHLRRANQVAKLAMEKGHLLLEQYWSQTITRQYLWNKAILALFPMQSRH